MEADIPNLEMYITSSNIREEENNRHAVLSHTALIDNMSSTSDLHSSVSKEGDKKISFTIGKKRKINGKVSPIHNDQDIHLSRRSKFADQESDTQEFPPSPNGSVSSDGGGVGSGFSSGDNESIGSLSVEEDRQFEVQSIMKEHKGADHECENDENSVGGMGYSSTISHEVEEQHAAQHQALHDEYNTSLSHVNNPLASATLKTVHQNDLLIDDRQKQHSFSPKNIQSDGWRVKLYRLNADGSWDDCGTGRIICHTSDVPSTVRSGSPLPTSGSKYIPQEKAYRGSSTTTTGAASFYRNWANVEEDIYRSLGEPTLCMYGEIPMNIQSHTITDMNDKSPKVLLRTRVLLRESYQRQGDNIITWCEPYFSSAVDRSQLHDGNYTSAGQSRWNESMSEDNNGVDLALSFQDNAGCRDIWNKISKIQHDAHQLFDTNNAYSTFDKMIDMERVENSRNNGQTSNVFLNVLNENDSSEKSNDLHSRQYKSTPRKLKANGMEVDINHKASPSIQVKHDNQKFNHGLWVHGESSINGIDIDEQDFMEAEAAANSVKAHYQIIRPLGSQSKSADSMDLGHFSSAAKLPSPPTLNNLEEIVDIFVAAQPQQRDSIALFVSRLECLYLKQLLQLFPSAEARNDYHALATLASIIKSIFLFNEPSIMQLVTSDEQVFEDCCCCLEYDPDLREKANHRWFIRDRLRFRTVIEIEDQELIESIHKSFRVTFIRDTLLRPTMDESSLSTLSSLLTFTHADIVKAVMCAPRNKSSKTHDSYLVQIIRLLGEEIISIRELEWEILERKGRCPKLSSKNYFKSSTPTGSVSGCATESYTPWTQNLAPQDDSLSSRRIRRSGCLSFLKEMFNIVRTSLQQNDKDDFYAMIVLMDVRLDSCDNRRSDSQKSEENTVNLLSLLGAVLADINSDVSDRGACLEILSTIAMHDSSYIRKHVLDEFSISKSEAEKQSTRDQIIPRPEPNGEHQVIFACPPTDLLLSLLYVMATESDAGVMIQTCEVMRTILDTEMVNETGQLDLGGVIDNEEDELIGSDNVSFLVGNNMHNGHAGGSCEQNSFLNLFYDNYVPWLVAPFQFFIMVPKSAIPYSWKRVALPNQSLLQVLEDKHQRLKEMKVSRSGVFKSVSICSVRISFSLELLSFCIRAHFFRMKRYLINSRILIHIMKMLSPRSKTIFPSGDRCIKLGALRCLRSILSLKDDFYNRHIIQHKLFTPVFETFRQNLVGDNLIASSIIEICEFIRTENIRALIEYIVTKHLCQDQTLRNSSDSSDLKHSISLEDVATPYVDTLTQLRQKYEENMKLDDSSAGYGDDGDRRIVMNEKAMEDQRKFRETDEEESYFFDDEGTSSNHDYGGFQL